MADSITADCCCFGDGKLATAVGQVVDPQSFKGPVRLKLAEGTTATKAANQQQAMPQEQQQPQWQWQDKQEVQSAVLATQQ